ncbi:MAG: phage major capsid protein [Lachnospiraceae bacterium]|nr:phage major capsid protein [Lachnospiraceae bacterium]
MKLQELIAKRVEVWEAAKNFVETHQKENGTLSAEDNEAYEKMEAEITDLTSAIDRARRAEEREAEMAKPVNTPLTTKPQMAEITEEKTGRASDEYRKAMLNALRTNFRQVSNVLQEGVDSDGGYLVPDEYDKRLIDVLDEENIMRGLATKITTSGEHKINIAATKPAAAWIEEGEQLTFGDATFDQKMMDAHKLHVAIKVTEELLYDNAFGLENYIITQFGKALANAEEDAFLNGDGEGKPTGIFHATKGGEKAVTTSSASAITADEIIDLVYKLKRPYRKKASFIMNDSTLPGLRKLKDNNGQYLWQPSLVAGEPDRLFGYPLHTSAFAPEIKGGKPAVSFGDYKYYNIGDRGSRSFTTLRELFAGNGMIGYVAKERVDGLLILPEAVQILYMKGTSSSSGS